MKPLKSLQTTDSANLGFLRRPARAHRTCWSISNDISEGLPVTKAELLRAVKWERQNTHRNQIAINQLRDAMVKIGLMLTTVEQYSPHHHEIFKVISDALNIK